MAVRIMTDSAADYTAAEIAKRNIICVPMLVNLGGEEYLDGITLTKEAFYEKLKDGYPKTSQPSPAAFQRAFEEAKAAGDTVVVILISGALSGTLQSAHLAKNIVDYPNIYIIDSCTATLGMRILVDQAVTMARRGTEAEEIVRRLEELKPRVTVYAALDTLEYLAKGGRLPKSVAGVGNLVSLKPVIALPGDGSVAVIGKQIGMHRAYRQISALIEQDAADEKYPFYFIYCADKRNCAGFVQYLRKQGKAFDEPKLRGIGPTIASHIGPGAFGVVYVKKQ